MPGSTRRSDELKSVMGSAAHLEPMTQPNESSHVPPSGKDERPLLDLVLFVSTVTLALLVILVTVITTMRLTGNIPAPLEEQFTNLYGLPEGSFPDKLPDRGESFVVNWPGEGAVNCYRPDDFKQKPLACEGENGVWTLRVPVPESER